MISPHDRGTTPKATFDGRGGAARPTFPARLPVPDACTGGQTAKEIRPMDLTRFQLPAEFSATQRPADRRHRTHQLEHAVMQPIHPTLTQTIATMRIRDMQDEAARQRTLRQIRAARAVAHLLTVVRRAVGAMLVRAGERVQGAERATVRPVAGTSDLTVAGTHLRLVR